MKFEALRRFALSLEGTTESPHHHYASFRVNGKIYVTVPPALTHIHVFVPDDAREQALAMYPEAMAKLLWGGKVVGVRVSLDAAAGPEVKALVRLAWASKNAITGVTHAYRSTRLSRRNA